MKSWIHGCQQRKHPICELCDFPSVISEFGNNNNNKSPQNPRNKISFFSIKANHVTFYLIFSRISFVAFPNGVVVDFVVLFRTIYVDRVGIFFGFHFTIGKLTKGWKFSLLLIVIFFQFFQFFFPPSVCTLVVGSPTRNIICCGGILKILNIFILWTFINT